MKSILLSSLFVVAFFMLAGCIINDELTTLTIRSDGSADWVRFQSNVRSTEKGEKGILQLKSFVAAFDAREDSDCRRITAAGGKVLDATWVRREEPYATLTTAKFPSAAALEKFCTFKDENGQIIAQARFIQTGNRRKLSLNLPANQKASLKPTLSLKEFREQQANVISETRVVVAGGTIIASQGFVIAADKRSALLDPCQIDELLAAEAESFELFLEWELEDS